MSARNLLSILIIALAIVAIESLNEEAEILDTKCLNPNGKPGQCVSLFDCEALSDVVFKQLKECYRFLQMSQCLNGRGQQKPYVCCTSETQFSHQLWNRKNGRIIFPGAVSRSGDSQRTNERIIFDPDEGGESEEEKQVRQTSVYAKLRFPQPPRCGSILVSNRIFGGVETELNEFPWMVILEYYNSTTENIVLDCSGSLINERYILTAAHCVQGDIIKQHGKLISARIGDHNTKTAKDCSKSAGCLKPFQRFSIESVLAHADYDKSRQSGIRNHNDIALLRLSRSVKFEDGLQPVCLPTIENPEELPEDLKLIAAGWGHNGTEKRTAEKRKVQLPFVPLVKCRQFYAKRFYVADEQICAGGIFKEDTCTGDSGGPLMRLNKNHWVLEGVVSFGIGCGVQRPGIYTNVRAYLNWIYDNTR